MLFHERINKIIEEKGWKDKKIFIDKFLALNPISKRTKKTIGNKVVYAYLSGDRSPDAEHYPLIAKALSVHIERIFNDDIKTQANNNDYVSDLPNITNMNIGAGQAEGELPDVMHMEKVPVTNSFLNGANKDYLTIFQVSGDSMYPTISPNDWVIVDMVASNDSTKQRMFEKIDAVYLVNMNGSIQIKRLAFNGGNDVDIISDNPAYPVKNTIKNNIDLFIVGKLFKHVHDLGQLIITDVVDVRGH